MSTTTIARAPVPATMTDEEFISFVHKRPHGERWQLIEADVVMMNPPRLQHQRVAGNLATQLNVHFGSRGLDLFAFQEVGVIVPGVKRFRPTVDLAVIRNSVDPTKIWADTFLLVGEVKSESNTASQIERKRQRYVSHPDNQCVLIFEQDQPLVEVWSRSAGWKPSKLQDIDAVLELDAFGFRTTLRSIYAGTGTLPPPQGNFT